jgi:hypothetical protein
LRSKAGFFSRNAGFLTMIRHLGGPSMSATKIKAAAAQPRTLTRLAGGMLLTGALAGIACAPPARPDSNAPGSGGQPGQGGQAGTAGGTAPGGSGGKGGALGTSNVDTSIDPHPTDAGTPNDLAGDRGATGGSTGSGGSTAAGGTGGSSGAGTGGASGTGGSGTPPGPGNFPLFVAQGMVGLTSISCDEGRSWTSLKSSDPNLICFSPTDCDHRADTGRGLAFGNGWFVGTFGWGQAGAIQRSRDGVTWTPVTSMTAFAGLAFGNDAFATGGQPGMFSTDGEGMTWNKSGGVTLSTTPRVTAFVPQDGGRFVMAASGTGTDLLLSSDKGATWWRPSTRPAECGGDMNEGGVASGNGSIVLVNGKGVACVSRDGGQTFSAGSVGGAVTGHLLFVNNEFMTWGARGLYHSADGQSWSATETVPANLSVGAVARADSGTFVATKNAWGQWYDKQAFYRSTDGVHWDTLPRTAFTGSHPVLFIAFGRVAKPAACP